MDAREDANELIELAGQAVAPIEEELRGRLTIAVAEKDALAIESALLKAFLNGVGTGSSEAAEMLIDQAGTLEGRRGSAFTAAAALDQPLPRIDPWAEKYAGDG
jgi:hypothetical protein